MGENLDDLILTDPEPQGKKSKGLLVILGLVVLLLIIGVILANMIFGPADDINATKEEIEQENIVLNNAPQNLKAQKEELDPDLAPLDETPLVAANEQKPVEEKKNPQQPPQKEEETQQDDEQLPMILTPITREEPKAEVKKEVVNHPPKPKPKPKPKPVERKRVVYGGSGNVYIQVGSFTKGPNQSFITKIRKAGFKYRIKQYNNGIRRVYVGPFRSRAEAKRYLGIVKDKITPEAFIKGNI